jgi:CxxC motif-containing protein
MEEVKKVVCIVCPLSCAGEVTLKAGEVFSITGLTCERGKKYARAEVTEPKRMLTTTVKVKGGFLPLLPVVSKEAIPKEKIKEAVKFLATITVEAPIRAGDVVYQNIVNSGVTILASRDIPGHS